MSSPNFDKRIIYRMLSQNITLLEEYSASSHEIIKAIIEQVIFHREQLRPNDQEVFSPRITKVRRQLDNFGKEYRQLLREPKHTVGIPP